MAKKKKKPSLYNKHVAREMKAGKTMKQAAVSWKKKPSKTASKKKPSQSRKTTIRKQTIRRIQKPRPQGQKTMFPLMNRLLFKGGPIRTKMGSLLGR